MKKKKPKNTKTTPNKIDEFQKVCYAICFDCAKSHGATWPYDEYVCTSWFDICGICKEEKACCSVRDWKWPGNTWTWSD